jgi:hypothetical protein
VCLCVFVCVCVSVALYCSSHLCLPSFKVLVREPRGLDVGSKTPYHHDEKLTGGCFVVYQELPSKFP